MDKIVHFPKEEKAKALKEKARAKLHDANEWIKWHKEEIVTYGPIAIAGITTTAKVVGRRINLHKEETLKNLYCYDRSLGHYWRLKRPLSNREWVAIESRRKRGERLADILSSMNVLK